MKRYQIVTITKNILRFILPLSLAISSCEYCDVIHPEESDDCSVDNPVEDLVWLCDEIRDREQQPQSDLTQYFYIAQSKYEGETVFIYGNCCPTCNTIVPVLNCEGEQIGLLGHQEENIDYRVLEQAVIIWKPADHSCTL